MLPSIRNTVHTPIKEVLFARYLGIDFEPRHRNYYHRKITSIIDIATDYATAIKHISKVSIDKVSIGLALWKGCAIPSILYASECLSFTKTALKKLDQIQCSVAKELCQIGAHANGAGALVETGLIPLSLKLKERKIAFMYRVKNMKQQRLLHQAWREHVGGGWRSRWLENEAELVKKIDEIGPDLDIELEDWTKNYLGEEFTRCMKSLCVFPRNYEIGSPNIFIDDTWQSKILCEFRAGDAGLGNRRPTPGNIKLKLCPLCKKLLKTALILSLIHI